MCPKDYYSDKDSEEMISERKIALIIGYFGTISILMGYLFLVAFLIYSMDYSIWINVGYLILLILSIFVVFLFLHFIFIRDQKNALRYGVSLNDRALFIYGNEIAIPSILEAKVVEFKGSGVFLAVGYNVKKKGKNKTTSHLLRENDTKNIYELRDKIRELKGWPEQKEVPEYRWNDWKKHLDKLGVDYRINP